MEEEESKETTEDKEEEIQKEVNNEKKVQEKKEETTGDKDSFKVRHQTDQSTNTDARWLPASHWLKAGWKEDWLV